VALLAGKPLVAWTIEAARASGIFEDVVVSSDDDEILSVAERFGARPLERDPALAGDAVSTVPVLLDAVGRLGMEGAVYQTLPTSPLRRPETFVGAWTRFRTGDADTLLSVVALPHPPQWALTERDGYLVPLDPQHFDVERGALAPTWRHDGGHCILDVASLVERRTLLGPRTVAFPVPADEAVDVDEPADLEWARHVLERRLAA
jgi:N-acylneuraminate cytidylyltransferase